MYHYDCMPVPANQSPPMSMVAAQTFKFLLNVTYIAASHG